MWVKSEMLEKEHLLMVSKSAIFFPPFCQFDQQPFLRQNVKLIKVDTHSKGIAEFLSRETLKNVKKIVL